MNNLMVIFWFLLFIGTFYLWQSNYGLRQQLSQTSGEIYQVLDQPGYSDKAELLGKLHQNLRKIVQVLSQKYPNQPETQRLVSGFKNTQLIERSGPHRFTSYSVNKGQKIVMCLNKYDNCDSKETDCPLIDLNTLTFVGLHELAHIMTLTVDDQANSHSVEFWNNYSRLLKLAQELGLYQLQNYQIVPVTYCGQLIENSPLL